MKRLTLKRLFVLLIFFISVSTINRNLSSNDVNSYVGFNESSSIEHKELLKQIEQKRWEELKDSTLDYIRWHEGERFVRYHTGVDTDGPTIGYGHLIKRTDIIPDTINKAFADSLLESDYNAAMRAAKIISPTLKEYENRFKLLAIAHFIFAKGSGNYQKSEVRRRVDNGQDIKGAVESWSYITVKGVTKRNARMLKNRHWEIQMYNTKR